jgi:hypothetical protein
MPLFAPPQTQSPAPPIVSPSPGGIADGSSVSVDPLVATDYQPEKGELKIKERRSWKTWQLLVVAVLAALVGMWFNGNSGSASGSSGSSSSSYKLPPAAGSSSASSAHSTATTAAAATPTTAAGSSTTTTAAAGGAAAGSSTSTTVAVGPATVLVPEIQQAGNWTSPAFTIAGGTWQIGWAFQCTPAPSAPAAFQIFVVKTGAAAGSTPAVTSGAAAGNSVTSLTTVGSQQVIVQTSSTCRWAVKVTGSSS